MSDTDNWKMYAMDLEDGSATCLVNIGLMDDAPDKRRPVCMAVRIPFENPGEGGFGDQDERDALAMIEDVLLELLKRKFNIVNVATVRGGGNLDLWFYAPKGVSEKAEASIREAYAGRDVEVSSHDDPEWSRYTDVLFPDEDALRSIGNMEVIEAMREAGDPLDVPRPVEYLAMFHDEQNAKRFAAAAETEGFAVASIEHSDEFDPPWAVEVVRESAVLPEAIDDATAWLTDAAAEYGGVYDGWQAMLLDENGKSAMEGEG